MSKIVAVAGGSGGLGRSIIDALNEDKKYTALILARKVRLPSLNFLFNKSI
jgi:NAD(P)-dependent dehydrogenase (short-subunit alcohol dehydrogenase family)